MPLRRIVLRTAEVSRGLIDDQTPASDWTLTVVNLLIAPACCRLIYAAATADLDRSTGLRQPRLIRLGEASFALYMTHYLVLLVLQKLGWHGSGWAGLVMSSLSVLLCLAVGLFGFLAVERPAERRLRRRLSPAAAR